MRPGAPADDWARRAAVHSSAGLAVVDADGRFLAANPAAAALCGLDGAPVTGVRSPFRPGGGDGGELVTGWEPAPGERREFAYVVDPVPGAAEWVVCFRDVTAERVHQRRLAAIAGAAAEVAARRSLSSTLEVLAHEVLRSDGLAGVQVLTLDAARERLQVLGAAGFGREPDFFEKLVLARDRGARLRMLDALRTGEPVVVPHRYEESTQHPAWEPLWDFLRHPRWDTFVSVPLVIRGEPVGVLNAFFAPDQTVGDTELGFLVTMAEQAALAVDQAEQVEREGELARREERQRLARDLHDSVVQQVFSMMMQATSLGVLVQRGLPPTPERVAEVAGDLAAVAEAVLQDLRGMVVELRPVATEGQGLAAALRSFCATTGARTGLAVELTVDDPGDVAHRLGADLVEDVYRVLAEAVHNSVKHAGGSRVDVGVTVVAGAGRPGVTATVADDGRGMAAAGTAGHGHGMTAMRERAARWGGVVQVDQREGGGTLVRLAVPAAVPVRTVPADHWTASR
ncbi:GAF domain-containing sensor histidine kinase [Modestobacter sp. NPDC049651]|uniref:GAF domain-containing sensor histidine kinase n=1 Tax=unclassified Modestobacter TaxID=2643866 RepID=UPI0033F8F191